MSKDWESVFASWSQGPGKTEQERAENTERQIRQAIQASDKLKNRNISVFTQGSYRNRVNVRQDSDVDVGVVCFDTYFSEYPDDNVRMELAKSFTPATYEYETFKNDRRKMTALPAVDWNFLLCVNTHPSSAISRNSSTILCHKN